MEPLVTVGTGMDERSSPSGVYSSSVSGCVTVERVPPCMPPASTMRFSGTKRACHSVAVTDGEGVPVLVPVPVPLDEAVELGEDVRVGSGEPEDEMETPPDSEEVAVAVEVTDEEAVKEGVLDPVAVRLGVLVDVSVACTASDVRYGVKELL